MTGTGKGDAADDLVVQVETGAIRGMRRAGVRVFLGVPYAAPPVGDRRWRSPEPPSPWIGVRDATAAGPACPQPNPGGATKSLRYDEDCLYLNITTPATSSERPRPVMVWVHGGAFTSGAGVDYDTTRLVTGGEVIVVTINYRLHAIGFFGYPGLRGSGTFGLQDQQEALRWVRRNAAAFGGDPNNVTLFGESAGSMSACFQLASPAAAGLFDKAILQSGTSLLRWERNMMQPDMGSYEPFAALAVVEQRGVEAADRLRCADIDALRKVSADDLIAAFPAVSPAWGGAALPENPASVLRGGRIHKLPVMAGGTREEHRAFVNAITAEVVTNDRYPHLLQEAFGDRGADVTALYPVTYKGALDAWALAASDQAWCFAFFETFKTAAAATTVYAYEFADEDAPNPAFVLPEGFSLKAGHATELAYLFDLGGVPAELNPRQQDLAAEMIGYWTRFAATGDPNGGAAPSWPAFKTADAPPAVMAFAPAPQGPALIDFALRHRCDFWAEVLGRAET